MAKQTFNVGGLDQLVRNMHTLQDNTIKKATRSGINAGLTPLAKTIRKNIDNTVASVGLKRAAKRTIGKRLKKRRGKYQGKAGFAVGKPSRKKRDNAHTRSVLGQGGGIFAGVGISSANIHWFVLGTKERFRKNGRTGKVQPVFRDVVPTSALQASSAVASKTKTKIAEVIEREAAKMRT